MDVPLTLGRSAVIDEPDAPIVAAYSWHAAKRGRTWYAACHTDDGRKIYMHRLILAAPEGQRVDHADGDGLNNRRDNLRYASQSQNIANSGSRVGAVSKYKGVYPSRQPAGSFCAQITKDGKCHHLGTFRSEIEAAKAYDQAAWKMFGEFARLNVPEIGEWGCEHCPANGGYCSVCGGGPVIQAAVVQ